MPKVIDLHRVIDHELAGEERVDLVRITAELGDGVAHRREIHHCGHAGEVLQHDARRVERDLGVGLGLGIPGQQRLDVLLGDDLAVFEAQQVLEQDAQRKRQPSDVFAGLLGQLGQREVGELRAFDFDLGLGGK